ncbi:syntaxin-132-like protein, partial [Tanacetum coccineum]
MYSIGIKLRMRSCIDRYIFVALQIKTSLDTIDEENTLRKQQPGHGEGTAYERMHTSVTRGLKQNFNKRLSAFRALQEHIHQENHELIKRRVYTVTGNWPNEEAIDRLMETGQDEYITRIAIEHGQAGQIHGVMEKLGYVNDDPIYYHYLIPDTNLDMGLRALGNDLDVRGLG